MKYTLLNNGVETTQYSGTLEENKREAIEMISQAFIDLGKTNTYTCSLGFEIDNRWIEKNDIDNAQLSIDVWFQTNPIAAFRDSNNNSHTVNKDQMLQIIIESKINRLQKMSIKWKREYLVENSSTIEQVWQWVEATDAQIGADI